MSLPLRWEDPPSPEPRTTPPNLPSHRRRVSPARRLIGYTMLISLALLVGTLTTLGAQSVWNSVHPSTLLRPDAQPEGLEVSASNPSIERRLGFVTVTGSVINHVDRPIAQVEAVVELLDSKNETVQVETGLIAFDPLLPGQKSPFRVDLPDNTHAVGYRIRFKQLSGAMLN